MGHELDVLNGSEDLIGDRYPRVASPAQFFLCRGDYAGQVLRYWYKAYWDEESEYSSGAEIVEQQNCTEQKFWVKQNLFASTRMALDTKAYRGEVTRTTETGR